MTEAISVSESRDLQILEERALYAEEVDEKISSSFALKKFVVKVLTEQVGVIKNEFLQELVEKIKEVSDNVMIFLKNPSYDDFKVYANLLWRGEILLDGRTITDYYYGEIVRIKKEFYNKLFCYDKELRKRSFIYEFEDSNPSISTTTSLDILEQGIGLMNDYINHFDFFTGLVGNKALVIYESESRKCCCLASRRGFYGYCKSKVETFNDLKTSLEEE